MSRKALTNEQYIEKYGYEEGLKRIIKRDYDKEYRSAHKEQIAAYQKEYQKDYRAAHREESAAYKKVYQAAHREESAAYQNDYRSTHFGRAIYIIGNYKRLDKRYNRGECTLTPDWIVNNIFTSKCVYCGESDWTKLGCDRIDNSQPHIPSNVVCCCGKCNREKGLKNIDVFKNIKKKEVV